MTYTLHQRRTLTWADGGHMVEDYPRPIRQALVDRFAHGEPNYGKGTKARPGFFHGFSADVWQAYALAVYAADVLARGGAR